MPSGWLIIETHLHPERSRSDLGNQPVASLIKIQDSVHFAVRDLNRFSRLVLKRSAVCFANLIVSILLGILKFYCTNLEKNFNLVYFLLVNCFSGSFKEMS